MPKLYNNMTVMSGSCKDNVMNIVNSKMTLVKKNKRCDCNMRNRHTKQSIAHHLASGSTITDEASCHSANNSE